MGCRPFLLVAPDRRCWSYNWFIGVSLLTVARGIINTLCCSPNYAMQINVLSMQCTSKGTTCNYNSYDTISNVHVFTFAKRRIRPPEEVSNTNHFGSVSDSLGRLAAVSKCMASVCCLTIIMLYNFRVITMSRYCLINCIGYSSPKTL